MISRIKAVQIPPQVKKKVAERDSFDGHPCCILCGSPSGIPEAHIIPRSQNGLGIEENIVTLCRKCHRDYDQSDRRDEIRAELIHYIKSKYPDWSIEKVTYRK